MSAATRAAVWVKEGATGIEFAEITLEADRLEAAGVAIGLAPVPYRLDYVLKTRRGFVTSRLRATTRGDGWRRELDLRRAPSGNWTITARADGEAPLPPPVGNVDELTDAVDCDLGLSPLTNTLPVLRNALLQAGAGSREFCMAWISVPDLGVHADYQRYTFQRSAHGQQVIRYEAVDGTFTSDISFDRDGLVVDYPGLARRSFPA